jgi:hypothetical protein
MFSTIFLIGSTGSPSFQEVFIVVIVLRGARFLGCGRDVWAVFFFPAAAPKERGGVTDKLPFVLRPLVVCLPAFDAGDDQVHQGVVWVKLAPGFQGVLFPDTARIDSPEGSNLSAPLRPVWARPRSRFSFSFSFPFSFTGTLISSDFLSVDCKCYQMKRKRELAFLRALLLVLVPRQKFQVLLPVFVGRVGPDHAGIDQFVQPDADFLFLRRSSGNTWTPVFADFLNRPKSSALTTRRQKKRSASALTSASDSLVV